LRSRRAATASREGRGRVPESFPVERVDPHLRRPGLLSRGLASSSKVVVAGAQPKAVEVVEVVEDGPVAAEAGSKVTTNGERIDAGITTGTPSTLNPTARVPSSTLVAPVAWICWTPPACIVPVHRVEPVDAEVALTQHGPVVEMVRR
jgi:hypothetical protein